MVINFVDYSLNQGAPAGHESAETPIGHESNGAVAGEWCHFTIAEEAINFMSYVAEVLRGWDEPNARDMGRMTSQPNAKEMTNMQEVQAISQTPLQAMPCSICRSYEHLVDECPTIPRYKQHVQALPQALSLEQAMVNLSKVVGDFVGAQKSINAQLSQRIDSVEMQEKENSPSQPYQNSMSIHEMEAQEGESSMVKEVKNEKEKREEIKGKKKGKSIEKDGYDVNVQREPQRIVIKEEMMKHMPPPFLQALYGKIIQTKSQVRNANFIWDPGKLNQEQIFDGLSLFKD
ncbi:hypothetical protein CK203_105255 [Vitis vinifera]|uniref:Uncharacterized protein n=1 Tax=Vitis vinifera TaxID=29760 RepID=A0A438FGQ4_VITVI|nr:hypothetical protein CK203_105255 [Vitis vinifera]